MLRKVKNYIINLIAQGEGQMLDFKFEISDSKKIARSLAAFANTDGGTLLIGVKDNGSIAGVRSDEEYYMLEAAAQMYCKPEVEFEIKNHNIEGKIVMETIIKKSKSGPHSAIAENGKWMVFIRQHDQNLLADPVLLKVWKREKRKKGVFIKYSKNERILLNYLLKEAQITLRQYMKLAQIPKRLAENILVNLITLNILDMVLTEKETYYHLNPNAHLENSQLK